MLIFLILKYGRVYSIVKTASDWKNEENINVDTEIGLAPITTFIINYGKLSWLHLKLYTKLLKIHTLEIIRLLVRAITP